MNLHLNLSIIHLQLARLQQIQSMILLVEMWMVPVEDNPVYQIPLHKIKGRSSSRPYAFQRDEAVTILNDEDE